MNAPMLERMESSNDPSRLDASGCPLQGTRMTSTPLGADEELVFPQHKRLVTQYSTDATGNTELHLYYGEKEIAFDEPELFAFGEGLAKHARFVARAATTWGPGYQWPRVRKLLEQLLDEGILKYVNANGSDEVPVPNGPCPSPLPPAESTVARTWLDCEAIMRERTGQPLELGYLECVIPIYRVAHIALDAEGRQVGEANVFPTQLRLDVPTQWRTCPHAGSRYQDAKPMNVTALKSMREHWRQMMAALVRIREAYLCRFPQARSGWTVGDLQRLCSLVLTVPAYLLMRAQDRVENGYLHPVLSSMFRVTDGVQMTMFMMLYSSTDGSTHAPDAPISSGEIYAYAERNDLFHSAHGVCAGPKAMIEEFLSVLVDGKSLEGDESLVLDGPVESALDHLDSACDYCLYGLQTHAAVFSLWPRMGQAYDQLLAIVETWLDEASESLIQFRNRLRSSVLSQRMSIGLRADEYRVARERVYEDMYAQCARGRGSASSGATLAELLAPISAAYHTHTAEQLRVVLRQRLCPQTAAESPAVDSLVVVLMAYLKQEQAVVRAASGIQQRMNDLLGRTPPRRPLKASDLHSFDRLQEIRRRQAYLIDDLEETLGLHIVVTPDTIDIRDCRAG